MFSVSFPCSVPSNPHSSWRKSRMISAWQYSLSPYLTSPLVYTPYRFLRVRTNDRRSSVPLDNTAQGGSLCAQICRLPCKNYESLIMNCLGGVVERDARPPILFTPLLFYHFYFFTTFTFLPLYFFTTFTFLPLYFFT